MIVVLFVDDESGFLEQAEIFLEKEDEELDVETCGSVEEALESLSNSEYDVVVSDYQMPEVNGLEFLEALREERGSDIPFIMFTGKGREEVAVEALNLGADRYLQKGGDPKSQYSVLADAIVQEAEQKEVEEELERERGRAQRYLETAEVMMVGINRQGEVIEANRKVSEVLGYDKEEIIGKNWFKNFVPKEHKKEVQEIHQKAGENEYPEYYENPVLTKSGEERTILWHNSALKDEEGNIIGTLSSGMDITERKKMEEQLRESEKRFRELFESVKVAIIVHDSNGEIVSANPAAEEAFNLKEEELKEKSLKDWKGVLYKENGELMSVSEFPVSRVYDSKKTMKGEVVGISPEGKNEIKWYVVSAVPQFNKEREIERVITSFKNITKRKKAREKLRENKDRLSGIVRGISIPVFVLDKDHNVVHWNKALEKLSGIHQEEILETNEQWKAFYEKERPVLADLVLEQASEEKIEEYYGGKYEKSPLLEDAYEVEEFYPNLGKDGKWLYFTATPIKDEEGHTIGAIETLQDFTERKKVEKKLKKERKRFQEIFNNANDAIYLHDLTEEGMPGEFIEVNDVACEMLGYSREEFLEMSPRDIDSSEKADEVPEVMEKLFNEGDVRFEMKHQAKDGTKIPVEINSHLLELEDEKKVLSVARDISERKKGEKELKKSREKYRSLFEEALDPIFLADAQTGIIVDCNTAAVDLIGRNKSDIVGEHQSILHPFEGSKEEFTEVFLKHRQEKQGEIIETQVITESGELRDVAIKANLIEAPDNTLIQGIFRDITERKKREEKLKKNEKRLKGSQRVADVGSWEIDLDTGELTWSDETYRIFGLPIGEPVTYDEFLEFIHPEDRDYVDKEWTKALETGEYDIEHRIVVNDEIKWVHEKADIIFNDDGEPIRVVGSVQDITERKKRKEREKLLHSLLRHDVQNKAQVVEGYLELLKEDPEGNKEYVDKALKAVKESEDIIEKVRTLRKLEKEEIENKKMYSVLKEVMEENRDRANEKGIEIKKTSSSLDCKVKSGSLLKELFNNITENAIQHSEGTKIKITSKEKPKEVICSIEDDGKGIPDEQKDKVFEKGYKHGETGGSGLGMYLAKQIIDNYDGDIEVKDSELGGARFDVTLEKP